MSRIEKIKEILDELSLDAFYITHIPNIRYITGFSGSSAIVIVTKGKNYFITDFRYKEQSAKQVKGFDISVNYLALEEIKKIFSSEGFKSVGFESTRLTVHQLENLQKNFPGVKFTAVAERIEKLTMVKTPDEIEKLKKAAEITDKTFSKLLEIIKPGMSEKDVSAEISYWHKKFGAEKDSSDPIVASGWRGCLPHGVATDKIIERGEMVTLDFGCVYEGFCSDLTRTIAVGEPSDEMKKIYNIVYDSQLEAIKNAKTGITTKELDSTARDFINKKGYGEKFGHGLGHGLGIEVHEMPSVSQRTDVKLPEGVIVTIEPGIYIENLGGVRIEDDVLIKNGGCVVLNSSSKELIII
ncbi:MAG: Xaa-Pro peptidase family protein [Chlorobi bacterium]|nr:Xaa-Pro peptidase family protein [Chlorobiota bacterium]